MTPEEEHSLVGRTITRRESGYLVWEDRIVRESAKDLGLLWRDILDIIRAHIDKLQQQPEVRERWKDDFKHWYKLLIPTDRFADGYFIEFRIDHPDMWTIEGKGPNEIEDDIIVRIVNCHKQTPRP